MAPRPKSSVLSALKDAVPEGDPRRVFVSLDDIDTSGEADGAGGGTAAELGGGIGCRYTRRGGARYGFTC